MHITSARNILLLLTLIFCSFFWIFLIPGDPAFLLAEDSASSYAHASVLEHRFFSWYSLIHQKPILPELARAWAISASWILPALLGAMALTLVTAPIKAVRWVARFFALWPLIVVAPLSFVLLPKVGAVTYRLFPILLLGLHQWGHWHRIVAHALERSATARFTVSGRGRGLAGFWFFWRYRWQPISGACLAQMTTQTGLIFGSSTLLEILFRKPGIGSFFFDAVLKRDIPSVQWGLLSLVLTAWLLQSVSQAHIKRTARGAS